MDLVDKVIAAIETTLRDGMMVILPTSDGVIVHLIDGKFEARVSESAGQQHTYKIVDRTSEQVIATGEAENLLGAIQVCAPLLLRLNEAEPGKAA